MKEKKFIVLFENGEKLEVLHEFCSIPALVGYLLGLLHFSSSIDNLRIETK